jgi:hypothetical protein
VEEHGGPRHARVVDEEQVTGQRGALVGDAHGAGRGVEQRNGVGEGLPGGLGQPRGLLVVGGVVAAVEVGDPVVVRGAQQRFASADPVPGRQGVAPDALDACGGRGPLGRPGRFVTLGDPSAGDQDFAQVGAGVGDVPRGAQRLERERLVVEEELHRIPPDN